MKTIRFLLVIAFILLCTANIWHITAQDDDVDDTPYPFYRELDSNDEDPATGKDVFILQKFINKWGRTQWDRKPNIPTTAIYDKATRKAIRLYKKENKLPNPNSSLFDKQTAASLIAKFAYDGYRDANIPARAYGLKFKLYIPVYKDRSIETTATLLDADNKVLHKFRSRTRAHTTPGDEGWPAFDSSSPGLNEHTSNGNTPSGLMLMDFNTPEPEEYYHMYGPYNVLRAVRGIEGNAEFLVPQVRNGILVHSGYWTEHGWEGPPHDMPNSAGCVHAYLEDIKKISDLLLSIGCVANENPLGKLPYPFEPQGLMSIEVLEDDEEPLY